MTNYLTRQILLLVAACLAIAELCVFIPSATQFQYRWLDEQWQHFLLQYEASKQQSANQLNQSYELVADLSSARFYPPEFYSLRADDGSLIEGGTRNDTALPFDLASLPISHGGLLFHLMIGTGPDMITVFDSRYDEDYKASWPAALLRSEIRAYSWRIFLATLVIGILIIMPLYLFLIRRLVRPLSGIMAMIREFTQNPNDLPAPPELKSATAEIAAIGSALEELTEQVRRALRQKERLADIGEATAKINHDLRNILVAATLVADNLNESDDPKIRRIAPHIERAISDATMMTQNMMDYLSEAKTETASRFPISEMAENLSHDSQLTVTSQGADILLGAPNQFYRLLLNLGRNARRAGADKMTIDIWRAGHLTVIDISDNGPCISEELRPYLFSAFYSGHKRDTGLGLAIAKDLAVAMSGQLRLSRTSDLGSEFRLSLPAHWLTE